MMEKNMSNTEMTVARKATVPAIPVEAADNILKSAQEDAGFAKLLKFKKGKYLIGDDEVSIGTQYVAHASQWTKCWIKFVNGKVVDRRQGKVADGFRPPNREELDDNDQALWTKGLDSKPQDPWTLQYVVPFENLETGELVIFTTASVGGKIGVSEMCRAWAQRAKKSGAGQPIVTLSKVDMPTKAFGDVPRPHFEIAGWDEAAADSYEPPAAETLTEEQDDEIPF
jgi:hypothetical protein